MKVFNGFEWMGEAHLHGFATRFKRVIVVIDVPQLLCPGDELYPFEARGWFHTFDHKIIINSHAILLEPRRKRGVVTRICESSYRRGSAPVELLS